MSIYDKNRSKDEKPKFDDPNWYPSSDSDFKALNEQMDRHYASTDLEELGKELAYYRKRLRDPAVQKDPMQRTAVEGIIEVYSSMMQGVIGGSEPNTPPMTSEEYQEIEKLLEDEGV
jgi:hypothetical protein